MDDYATIVLPETLASFARTHPNVELEVTTGFTRDLLDRLGEDFDLVLATQKPATAAARSCGPSAPPGPAPTGMISR